MDRILKISMLIAIISIAMMGCDKDNDTSGSSGSVSAPTNLKVSSITESSAVLNWSGNADSYEIVVGDDHYTSNSNSYSVTNLGKVQTYSWKVRAKSGNEYSKWVDGPDFTTKEVEYEPAHKGAMKYKHTSYRPQDDEIQYFTFDNDGHKYAESGRIRVDLFGKDGQAVMINDFMANKFYRFYGGSLGWQSYDHHVTVIFTSLFSVVEPEPWNKGGVQIEDRMYAGKQCTVWYDEGYYKKTWAYWNGLTLYYEEKTDDGYFRRWEAQAVTLDIPDEAYTQTLSITWLP